MSYRTCLVVLLVVSIPVIAGCPKPQPSDEAPPPELMSTIPQPTEVAEEQPLTGQKVVLVVAPKDFRDEEYTIPRETLIEAGAEVEVASLETGTAIGVNGTEAEVTLLASDVQPEDYAAVVFVGGPGMGKYLDEADFVELAKRFAEADKVVAAICVAPVILANAGLLEGRRATVWESEQDKLTSQGATLSDQQAVVDGKIITAPGPTAAQPFADAIRSVLEAGGEATEKPASEEGAN